MERTTGEPFQLYPNGTIPADTGFNGQDIPGQILTANPDPNLARIADALERIAQALEEQNPFHQIRARVAAADKKKEQ